MTETIPQPRIIVGVDSSDNATRAAAWAAREATDRALPLHLVHALDFPATAGLIAPEGYLQAGFAAGDKLLHRVSQALTEQYPALAITTETSELGAAETLVALSRGAELVVTGTRGHGGFAGLLLGSVSLRLASHAHCPVVVVRGEQPGDPVSEIVLGVEPHESDAPIRFAFASAEKLGVHLRVVRAWWPLPSYSGYSYASFDMPARTSEEQAEIADLLKGAREAYPNVPVITDVVRGNAVPTLIESSRGSRLLVVGAHRHHGPLSMGAGYVVQGLLAHSTAPVAVVPVD
jgi:nucleotide-binding universal stress UspA family protein